LLEVERDREAVPAAEALAHAGSKVVRVLGNRGYDLVVLHFPVQVRQGNKGEQPLGRRVEAGRGNHVTRKRRPRGRIVDGDATVTYRPGEIP